MDITVWVAIISATLTAAAAVAAPAVAEVVKWHLRRRDGDRRREDKDARDNKS